jgi:hypothetical protein
MPVGGLRVLALISLVLVSLVEGVDYNKLARWERRTLYCEQSPNGIGPGHCYLTVGKDGTPKAALCNREVVRNQSGNEELRFTCDIDCQNADRDSVIR